MTGSLVASLGASLAASLGPHAGFIISSYAAAIMLIGGLSFWIWRDHHLQSRRLAQIDPRINDKAKAP